MSILSVFVEDHGDDDYPDEHEAADRRDEARQAVLDDPLWDEVNCDLPCSCEHSEADHTPGNGCERRFCGCRWWGP